MPAKLASARLLAEGDARPDPEARQLAGGGGVRGAPMNGGEPEAGSEFAIGAAAAGEVRRGAPGFRVTMCHPRGTGRVWAERKIILFLPPIPYPCQIHRGPEAKECSRQQRVNTPFTAQGIVLLGSSIGRGGGGWKLIPSKRGLCGVYSGLGDTRIPTGQ